MFFLWYNIFGFLIINIYSYEVIFHLLCQSQCQNIAIMKNYEEENNNVVYNYLYKGYDTINSSSIQKFPTILTDQNTIYIQVLGNKIKPGICGYAIVDGHKINTSNSNFWEIDNNLKLESNDNISCQDYSFLTINEDNTIENKTINFTFNINGGNYLNEPIINDYDYNCKNKTYYLTKKNDGKIEILINLYDLISPKYNGKLYISKNNSFEGKIYKNDDQLVAKDSFLDYNSEIKYILETINSDEPTLRNFDTLTYKIENSTTDIKVGIINFKICEYENCNLCYKEQNIVKCDYNFKLNTDCNKNKPYYYFDENNYYNCMSFNEENCKKINYGTKECVSSCKYPYSYEIGNICYKYCPNNTYTIEEEKKCVTKCPNYIPNYLIEYIYESQNESNLLRRNKRNINNINEKQTTNSIRILSDSSDNIIDIKKTCVAELVIPYYKVINKNEYIIDCIIDYFYYNKDKYLCTDDCSITDYPLFNNVTKENNNYNYCVKECDNATYQLGNVCHETCPYYINKINDNEKEICVTICNGKNFIHNEITKKCESECNHYLYISNSSQYYCMEKCNDNQFKYFKSKNSNIETNNDNTEEVNNVPDVDRCEECFCYDSCKEYSKYYSKNKVKECVDKCEENEYIDFETYECIDCVNGYKYNNFCYKECPKGTYIHLNLIEKKCVYPCPSNTFISIDEKSCVFSCERNQQNNGTHCLCLEKYYKNESNNECIDSCDVLGYMRLEEKKTCVKECPIYYKKENKTQSTLIDCVYSCDPDFPYLSEDLNECLKKCPYNLYNKINNKLICVNKLKEAFDAGTNNKNLKICLIILILISGILISTLVILILKKKCKKKLIENLKKKNKIKNKTNKKQNIDESNMSSMRNKKNDKNSSIGNSNDLLYNKV